MGIRRMVSKRIISSAKFLQMPLEAQALYFHLTINADDDGVAEAYPITRLLGTNADVIKILLAKDFIRQLNEDQVILINNWTEHNTIRADRKIDSIYKNLLPKDIKYIEAKPRSDVKDNSKRIGGQSTDGISKDKLSKVKKRKEKIKRVFSPPTLQEVSNYCKERKNDIDPETFVDFYSSKGWFVGKNKMKDWRAAVRTWEKRDKRDNDLLIIK